MGPRRAQGGPLEPREDQGGSMGAPGVPLALMGAPWGPRVGRGVEGERGALNM